MPALQFQYTTTTLTDAQIKALPTVPVEIIPAPGVGKIIFPIAAYFHLNWVADYASIGVDAQLRLDLASGGTVLLPIRQDVFNGVSALLDGGGPDGTNAFSSMLFLKHISSDVFGAISGLYDSDISNQPLTLEGVNTANAHFTGGDAGNSLDVTVFYTIIVV